MTTFSTPQRPSAQRPQTLRALGLLFVCLLLSSACAEEDPPNDTNPTPTSTSQTTPQEDAGGGEDVGEDTTEDDTSVTPDVGPPQPGEYGAPCQEDGDCRSNLCAPDGDDGGICSQFCLTSCDAFYPDRAAYCRADASRSTEEGLLFICYPSQDLFCQACADSTQCDGAPCVDFGPEEGTRCARPCETDDDCPAQAQCLDRDDADTKVCIKTTGSCSCSQENAGEQRPCTTSNAFGTCRGVETCDPAVGWTGCDAPEAAPETCDGTDENCNGIPDDSVPVESCLVENEFGACPGTLICNGPEGSECVGNGASAEVCDGLDNNCDGAVDEGFTDESGQYTLFEHCGGCNQTCEGRFSFADSIACDPTGPDGPRCIIETCQEGYTRVGDTSCVPLQNPTCLPCTQDSECQAISPGSRCLQLGDPSQPETLSNVCGRDCSQASPFGTACDDGFTCQALEDDGETVSQCVPSGGTCLCVDNDDDFAIPCQTESAETGLTCQGVRRCDGDSFGACELAQDVCDGIDNDCDGTTDNAFRSPDGRYSLDPTHCGRCNNDCGQLSFPNATGVCNTDPDTPTCAMQCLDGFVDLFNGTDDGCECQILTETDTPDGQDRNCDRIDGDVSRGVFVSKIGALGAAGTLDDPLNTVQEAIQRVQSSGGDLRDVYVSTGVYSENIVLQAGVNVYGGYSLDFLERDPETNQTTLLGVRPEGSERGTVTASGINAPTALDGFTIYGTNAVGVGGSSVALALVDSDSALLISNNTIVAGNGASGARGQIGSSGDGGISGGAGQNARSASNRSCSLAPLTGGSGGAKTCRGANVSGGGGGAASCPRSQRLNGSTPCNASNPEDCRNSCDEGPCSPLPPAQGAGQNGRGPSTAAGGAPTYDRWSDSGVCTRCGLYPALDHLGNPGENGSDGQSGAAGLGCNDPRGVIDAQGVWQPSAGRAGGDGQNGSGGGGGSAGSGLDVTPDASGASAQCLDTVGGSGGGGGSGGCAGLSGQGGTGGGASFVILVHYTQNVAALPVLRDNMLIRGRGGDGGNGGTGGVGGSGGTGALGGISVSSDAFCAEPGGRGGNGGKGGGGGGGGGGCGGISASIAYSQGPNDLPAISYLSQNTFVESGQGGLGGQGGGSTDNPGTEGTSGTVDDLITFD